MKTSTFGDFIKHKIARDFHVTGNYFILRFHHFALHSRGEDRRLPVAVGADDPSLVKVARENF